MFYIYCKDDFHQVDGVLPACVIRYYNNSYVWMFLMHYSALSLYFYYCIAQKFDGVAKPWVEECSLLNIMTNKLFVGFIEETLRLKSLVWRTLTNNKLQLFVKFVKVFHRQTFALWLQYS